MEPDPAAATDPRAPNLVAPNLIAPNLIAPNLIAPNLIDGRLRRDAPLRESIEPASGEPLGRYADAGPSLVAEAIAAARARFDHGDWSTEAVPRSRALARLAEGLQRRRTEFVELLARDNGKALHQAAREIDGAIGRLHYYAALTLTQLGIAVQPAPSLSGVTVPVPAGVAGIITPWNAPINLAVRSFAPALAAGCTVVMKMPGQTGIVNGLLHELMAESGLPPGVLNSFTESGNVGAPMLVEDPRVDAVSYTGSSAVGSAIMAAAAPGLKKLVLELGGKTPCLVFEDADLERAVPVLAAGITVNSGQFCMAGSRILAHEGIADTLRAALIEELSGLRIGPSLDPATRLGPVIDATNADRICRLVADAAAYATPLLPGGRPQEDRLRGGSYVRPALLEVSDVTTPIVQEEVFGPVATFEIFADEAAGIARANATRYGLAASVWTRDLERASRVGRALRAGTVWTNTWAELIDQCAEGGFGASGIGRLNGTEGLAAFTEQKTYVQRVTPGS